MNVFMVVRLGCFFCLFLSLSACETDQQFFYDFETEANLDELHWKCKTIFSLSDIHVSSGKKSLKMELYPSPYPGLSLLMFKPDWTKNNFLAFTMYNPEKKNIHLTIRIDDSDNPSYGDRYNKRVTFTPGTNDISISLNSLVTTESKRKINLAQVNKVILFLTYPKKKRTLYLDNLRVE